jgi:hypothetical protein
VSHGIKEGLFLGRHSICQTDVALNPHGQWIRGSVKHFSGVIINQGPMPAT